MKLERLGNITVNLDNKRIPLNSEERNLKSIDGIYPYVGANKIVSYINEYIFDEKILCVAEDGGSWGAQQNCAVIYEGKTWVNNHAHVLVENGKAKLEYLKYFLNQENLNKYITGTTRGKLTKSALESIKIPLPSLKDQIRIATVLSKAETLIQQRKESIDLLDEFSKSTFYTMFDEPIRGEKFERKPFKLVSTVRQGLQIPISERKSEGGVNRYPYITNQFINGGKIAEFIENPKPNVICTKDDILMTRTGNTGIVLTDVEGVFHNNFFLIDYDRNLLNKKYLVSFLQLPEIKKLILKKASTTTIPDLNHGDFYKITLPIPPLKLQNQFATVVEKAEVIKKQYNESLIELENLFGSLSQKAFKGELDLSALRVLVEEEEYHSSTNDRTEPYHFPEPKIVVEFPEKSIQSAITPQMQEFIKKTASLQKTFSPIPKSIQIPSNILKLAKQIEQINKMMAPFEKLPKIPESVSQAMKTFENIKSISSTLQEGKKIEASKITWEEVNFQQVSNWIKNKYDGFHFNSEMLIRFLTEEHVTFPNYYSSEELKINPKLSEGDDLKSYLFSALNNENPFIKLEQFFYDASKENIELDLHEEDYELIKDKEKLECSGVYFKIIE